MLDQLLWGHSSRVCDISCFFMSADFCQNQLFQKFLSGIPSKCQIDWIKIRPDILSGLICVHSVCKDYQQKSLGGKELMGTNHFQNQAEW